MSEPADPADPLEAIKRLYYQATKATIARDLDRAIALLKVLPDEDARGRAAVYMDGLAQMRSEWGVTGVTAAPPRRKAAAGSRRRLSRSPCP
ncbi:MAG: hypothetical protein U0802_23925 [Candidatus Binatia bacterium]